MGGVQMGWGGGVGKRGNVCLVNGEDGERLQSKLSPNFETMREGFFLF